MRIDLRNYPYPALLFPCTSGMIIEQQTGGLACIQHEIEGMFLPLPVQELPFFIEALTILHPGCCGRTLTFDEACKLDHSVLKRYNLPLEVNQEKRGISTEAWVHVRIMGKDDHWPYQPDSSTLQMYQRFARKIKPNMTREEIVHTIITNTLECPILSDFAGQEAILTWENCD